MGVFELEQPLTVAFEHGAGDVTSPSPIVSTVWDDWRLSVTSAPPPIEVPQSARPFLVRGTIPATESGGMLAVSDCFFDGIESALVAELQDRLHA